MRSIAVVGGSLAGLSVARALRAQGFDGRLTVFSDEVEPPYDRPPLSKSFLGGTVAEAELALLGPDEALELDWRACVSATALRPARGALELSDGTDEPVDAVVLATGARPRMPWPHVPLGVHVLRTLGDARSLRSRLVPGARLVVVGAGFIGAEVASTAAGLGLDVTVVEAAQAPLRGLGVEMGSVVAGLHADHGVRLLTGVGVTGFAGDRYVTGVRLADGRAVPADVVLVGVGVRPNVEWLAGAGLPTADGVQCNAYGATALPNVVALGDCATWVDPRLGTGHRLEHWTAARERGAIAASTLLSAGDIRVEGRAPYFWSDQYGLRLQVVGHPHDADSVLVEEGSVADRDFLAVYRRGSEPVAVLALGCARSFMRWRKQLSRPSAVAARVV